MKIVDIKTIPVDRYLFVQVETDEGITGLGESGRGAIWKPLKRRLKPSNADVGILVGEQVEVEKGLRGGHSDHFPQCLTTA